jgi:hypothetical protein
MDFEGKQSCYFCMDAGLDSPLIGPEVPGKMHADGCHIPARFENQSAFYVVEINSLLFFDGHQQP